MDDRTVEQRCQWPGPGEQVRVGRGVEEVGGHDEQVGPRAAVEVTLVGHPRRAWTVKAGTSQRPVELDGMLRVEGRLRVPTGIAARHGCRDPAPRVGRLDRGIGAEGHERSGGLELGQREGPRAAVTPGGTHDLDVAEQVARLDRGRDALRCETPDVGRIDDLRMLHAVHRRGHRR